MNSIPARQYTDEIHQATISAAEQRVEEAYRLQVNSNNFISRLLRSAVASKAQADLDYLKTFNPSASGNVANTVEKDVPLTSSDAIDRLMFSKSKTANWLGISALYAAAAGTAAYQEVSDIITNQKRR